ncbi:pyridoxal phosphate-dependent transferase [Lactifluus subvellereus]|nr:pyridoxal phosphate-dependent transferase [Lactifluus subvellereus]
MRTDRKSSADAQQGNGLRLSYDLQSFWLTPGAKLANSEGKEYIDMLSAYYSAVNQGHCHPRIVAALVEQTQRLTLSSRAFYNPIFGAFAEKAVETEIKLARKWAYEEKGVSEGRAIVLSAADNSHGRTIGAISMSTDPESRSGFGPYLAGVGPTYRDGDTIHTIRHGEIDDIHRALEQHGKDVAAFLIEPIQGEEGIVVPPTGYLRQVRELCSQHNVLLICDEIQTVTSGLSRTGKLLNPLGCAVAMTALDVLIEERLAERAQQLGAQFRSDTRALRSPLVKETRAYGLAVLLVAQESGDAGQAHPREHHTPMTFVVPFPPGLSIERAKIVLARATLGIIGPRKEDMRATVPPFESRHQCVGWRALEILAPAQLGALEVSSRSGPFSVKILSPAGVEVFQLNSGDSIAYEFSTNLKHMRGKGLRRPNPSRERLADFLDARRAAQDEGELAFGVDELQALESAIA